MSNLWRKQRGKKCGQVRRFDFTVGIWFGSRKKSLGIEIGQFRGWLEFGLSEVRFRERWVKILTVLLVSLDPPSGPNPYF